MPRHMALVPDMAQALCPVVLRVGPPGAYRVPLGARNCSNAEVTKQNLALLIPPEQQYLLERQWPSSHNVICHAGCGLSNNAMHKDVWLDGAEA